jgi:deoxyribodipyrimidine photo-lyase
MINQGRIEQLNSKCARKGDYVLYWMQAAQRAEYNHALEHAITRANQLRLPLIVVFGVTDSYPDANLRHYTFMFEGLQDVQQALEKKGIKLVIMHQSPELAAAELAEKASIVIVDAGHTRIQRKWRQYAATSENGVNMPQKILNAYWKKLKPI